MVRVTLVLIAGALILTATSQQASAGGSPTYNVGLGITLTGRTVDGANKAEVVLRNLGSQTSGPFRLSFSKYWELETPPGLRLKPYRFMFYSPVMQLVGNQTKSYAIVAKAKIRRERFCVAAIAGSTVDGASVSTETCSQHGEAVPLAMFVRFDRKGTGTDLVITVRNYGQHTSAPFYLWHNGPGWSAAHPGVPAGQERVFHAQVQPVNGSYSLSLAFRPSMGAVLISEVLQQGV